MLQTEPVPIYTLSRHLPLRVKPSSTMTDDELFELCARSRGLRIERTSEGELIIMSPTGGEGGRRSLNGNPELAGFVLDLGALA